MALLRAEGKASVVAVADPDAGALAGALAIAEHALAFLDLEELLELDLDGIVIATPSALHAQQAITALEHGVPVFVQTPLAPDAAEARAVLAAAQALGSSFAVDLSYRRARAAEVMRQAVARGQLGEVFAAELVFHDADGPDKPWLLDRRLAGGGCLLDLGTHLVDLLLWLLDESDASVEAVTLRCQGGRLDAAAPGAVEDFALAQLRTGHDVSVRLACSWFLPLGRDCAIECTLHGTKASLALTNVGGSYYDLRLERRDGAAATTLVAPPDAWGGRALCQWAAQLARGEGFDTGAAARLAATAGVLDDIYAAAGRR